MRNNEGLPTVSLLGGVSIVPKCWGGLRKALDTQYLQCLSSILDKGRKNSFSFIPPTLVCLWSAWSLISGKANEDQPSQAR